MNSFVEQIRELISKKADELLSTTTEFGYDDIYSRLTMSVLDHWTDFLNKNNLTEKDVYGVDWFLDNIGDSMTTLKAYTLWFTNKEVR